LIPPVLDFLARLIGLGDVATPVRRAIEAIRAPIDRVLDRVIGTIANGLRGAAGALGRLLGGGGGQAATAEAQAAAQQREREGVRAGVSAANRFAGRRIGDAILRPLLTAIRLRYRLGILEPVRQGSKWAIHGEIRRMIELTETFSAEPGDYRGRISGGEEMIIDANMGIALEKDALGRPLQSGEQTWLARARALNLIALLTPTGVIELQGRGVGRWRSTVTEPIPPEEQAAIMANFATPPSVGGGEADRRTVLEALFARRAGAVTPVFASGDRRVINGLAHRAEIDVRVALGPHGNMATYLARERGTDRFTVSVGTRQLVVVPLQPINPARGT
jgi:hypothetical protein